MIREDVLKLPPDVIKHGLADAARVVSHQATGQPFTADARMQAIPADVRKAFIEQLTEGA